MLNRARMIEEQITAWRRDFHSHPELGFKETRTAALVAKELEGLGYRVRQGVGRTGVIGDRGQGHPIVAIRADMDALPIQETDETTYTSQIPGVMHACGHDAHTAILLGVAHLLSQETFPGTLRLLFQPAEETADDDGLSGAPRMIEAGAMEGVDTILALHVDSSTPVGIIRVGSGPVSGGVDSFYATIFGEGGHGARPHEAVDPFYITGHVLLALNGIVSRRLDPFAPAVVSIGTLHGGRTENVIPESVKISGTIRFMNTDVQKQIHTEIERAFEIARVLGGDYELEFEIGTLPINNDPKVVETIKHTAVDLIGVEHVMPPQKGLGAEDFSCFTELAPGAMFGLGCRIENDERTHHNPRFDVDDGCLPIGVAILAEAALRLLRQGS